MIETSIDDIDLILKMDKQNSTQKYLYLPERLEFLGKKKNSLTVLLNDVRIGFVGLKINNKEAEISYIFDSDYTGEGYCSEIVKVLVDIAFNKLKLNEIYTYSLFLK